MICTYHYIIILDASADTIVRLYSKDFQADTADFKQFFVHSQDVLEACSVRLADGNCYFWSRYNGGNGWEHVGTSSPEQFHMNATKALLASTMPCDHVCFDLAMATEYMLQSIESIGISTPVKNAKKKKPE